MSPTTTKQMVDEYFSDRELGPRPRVEYDMSPQAWGGIAALVAGLAERGAFAIDFPENCSDAPVPYGTDSRLFSLMLSAEIPGLEWPLRTEMASTGMYSGRHEPYTPQTHQALDLIEFCFRHVAEPIQGYFHPFFQHNHLSFNRESGQREFRATINRIFARNGLAYELKENGRIERLAPPGLRDVLQSAIFNTGDVILDQLLEQARRKFLSSNPTERSESLEKLWDAWERLKSSHDPSDKKRSTRTLLDAASIGSEFRNVLERDAAALTDLGNDFMIRHTEVGKIPITQDSHVDYLFHRMFALIWLLLKGATTP